MATSKKLEIIYHDGQPDGIRSVRRHLSTVTTYVTIRSKGQSKRICKGSGGSAAQLFPPGYLY